MAASRGGSPAEPPPPAAKPAPAPAPVDDSASGLALALGPISLSKWDADARGDLIIVQIWTDVRPLRGAAGLVDWRLSGRLSSMIQSGRLTGAEGEQLLVTTGGRLGWAAALVMGLGSRVGFSTARFRAAVQRSFTAAAGLGARDVAVSLPGRDIEALTCRRAAELLLVELRATPHRMGLRRLTILEDVAGHKQLGGLIPSDAGRLPTPAPAQPARPRARSAGR